MTTEPPLRNETRRINDASRISPLLLVALRACMAIVALLNPNWAAEPPANSQEARELRHERGLVDHLVKHLDLPAETRQDLLHLAELHPHQSNIRLHGRVVNSPDSGLVAIPNKAGVADAVNALALDGKTAGILAEFAAHQDNLRQWELEAIHSMWYSEDPDERRKQEAEYRERLRGYRTKIIVAASDAMRLKATLEQNLGKNRTAEIFKWVYEDAKSRDREDERGYKEGRQKAIASCRIGLERCSFEGGIPHNCAGFLGLSIKEVMKRCPKIKDSRYEGKSP